MNYLKNFYLQLKKYWRTPEVFALVVMLGATAGLFFAIIFYIPLVLKITAVLVFVSVAFVMLNSQIKLAYWKIEGEIKKYELATIIKSSQDGIIIYNPNFKITSFNKTAESIFGLNANEILGKFIEPGLAENPVIKVFIETMFPSIAPQAIQISKGSWPQIVDLNFENPRLRLRTVLNEVKKETGETIGFIKVVQDKTREKNILESKDEFITVAAHQLRTPLTAMGWGLEYISSNAGENQELQKIIQEEKQLVERSLKIINDLLDAAKIEEGRFGYSFEKTDLNKFMEEIVLSAMPVARSRGINLALEVSVEKYVVYIDTKQVAIALVNLVDNAIKYNVKQGSVNIKLETTPDKNFVKIKIEDTGVGVPKNELGKLFTKFYRSSNVVQLEPNGSGLGLYIAKNIIKRHGGEIGFDSIEHRGTVFWFTLPLNQSLVPPQELNF